MRLFAWVPLWCFLAHCAWLGPIANSSAADAPQPSLAELAKANFESRGLPLTADEVRIFELIEEDSSEIDVNDKRCRADCLRWLCSDPVAVGRVRHRGIRLSRVTIDGRLDLRFLQLNFPISLWQSTIPGGLDLRSLHIPKLDLRGTTTSDIDAENLNTDGDLLLGCDSEDDTEIPFRATERVLISNATIRGDLGCTNGSFSNPGGVALQADGIEVAGTVYLGRAQVNGQLHFVDASIGGVVVCTDAVFKKPSPNLALGSKESAAARFDRLQLGGDLLLDIKNCDGEIRVVSTKVGGSVICSGADLRNEYDAVLSIARSTIGGHLYFDDGFRSDGRILLQKSHISGNVTAESDVELTNSQHERTIDANQVTVDGDIRLQDDFLSREDIALTQMKVGGDLLICNWKGGLTKAITVDLQRTAVAGEFHWHSMPQAGKLNLNLEYASVGTLCDEPLAFLNCASLNVNAFTYSRLHLDGNSALQPRLAWLKKHSQGPSPQSFLPQPYEAMVSALRNAGDDSGARDVEVAKEQHRKEHSHGFVQRWVWYSFLGPLIGFGYSPLDAFYAGIWIVLLGWALFWLAHRYGLIIRSQQNGGGAAGLHYPAFNAFIYSLETFAPLLKMFVSQYWYVDTDQVTGRVLRWYLWLHILTGWLIVSLIVAGLAGLIHR